MAGMKMQNISLHTHKEGGQKLVPRERTPTTGRGSAMKGRDNSHAVPTVAIEPPQRWMSPVTAPAWPTFRVYARCRKVGRQEMRTQPPNAHTPPPPMTT